MTNEEAITKTFKDQMNCLQRRMDFMRLCLAGWALLGFTLLIFAATTKEGAAQQMIVRARTFELVDGSGRPAAYLMTSSAGDASLSLLDRSGRERLILSMIGDEPRLSFRDAAGNSRIYLFTTKAVGSRVGNTGLILSDTADRNRMEITIQQDGSPFVILKDARGLPRLYLASSEGAGLIVDENGRRLFRAP